MKKKSFSFILQMLDEVEARRENSDLQTWKHANNAEQHTEESGHRNFERNP
jgi:hypothetical protein